jgi:hypothetical protein
MKPYFRFPDQLKVFGMQNLMLEADLAKLEKSGIEIGHIRTIKKDDVVDTELFDLDIRNQARKMADFYALYYCLENSIRRLISERLREKYGPNWWDEKVPDGVKNNVKDKQDKEKDPVLFIRSDDPLTYTNFGELIDIFNANWDDFADTIRSKKAMQQTLSQFNQIRSVIAHSCELNDDEIARFELLIKDWLRIQM